MEISLHNSYDMCDVYEVDLCKLRKLCEVRVKGLATVSKSKAILLSTWEIFYHLALQLIASASPDDM